MMENIKETINKKYSPECTIIEANVCIEMLFIVAYTNGNLQFVIANLIHIKRFADLLINRQKQINDTNFIIHYVKESSLSDPSRASSHEGHKSLSGSVKPTIQGKKPLNFFTPCLFITFSKDMI